MTAMQAVFLISAKKVSACSPDQLKRQKNKICAAAKKWRAAQPRGTGARIAEAVGCGMNALNRFEAGGSYSCNILRAYIAAGFDVTPLKLIKPLQKMFDDME